MVKRGHRVFSSGMLAALLASAALWPAGAAEAVTDANLPLILVKPLRDAGGLPAPDPGSEALNDKITTGMVRYLRERGAQRVQIRDARDGETPALDPKRPALTLEGDFSRMAGETADRDTYLMTARLFQEGNPRRVVAQWSGSARSLIYLTNNMRRDPRFSANGLVGEIGDRILETTGAFGSPGALEQQRAFARILKTLKSGKELQVKLTPVTPPMTGTPSVDPRLDSGDAYKLEIASDLPGDVYIVAREESGALGPMFVPEEGNEQPIRAKEPLLLPRKGEWKAPVVLKPSTLELVVLERQRRADSGDARPPRPDGVSEKPGAVLSAAFLAPNVMPSSMRVGAQSPGMGLDTEADVQVINAGNLLLPRDSGDREIARLMALIDQDGRAAWRVYRIKLHITPHPASGK